MYLHFFFNDTATTEIYTLSLHDALPIFSMACSPCSLQRSITDMMLERRNPASLRNREPIIRARGVEVGFGERTIDRKSTRLNSSHANISYAVFCLKKKKTHPRLVCASFP